MYELERFEQITRKAIAELGSSDQMFLRAYVEDALKANEDRQSVNYPVLPHMVEQRIVDSMRVECESAREDSILDAVYATDGIPALVVSVMRNTK